MATQTACVQRSRARKNKEERTYERDSHLVVAPIQPRFKNLRLKGRWKKQRRLAPKPRVHRLLQCGTTVVAVQNWSWFDAKRAHPVRKNPTKQKPCFPRRPQPYTVPYPTREQKSCRRKNQPYFYSTDQQSTSVSARFGTHVSRAFVGRGNTEIEMPLTREMGKSIKMVEHSFKECAVVDYHFHL